MTFSVPTSPIGAGDLPAATTTAAGIVTLAESGGTGATTPITGTDVRVADTVTTRTQAQVVAAVDFTACRKIAFTLTSDATFPTPTGLVAGAEYDVFVTQDGTGGWELVFPAIFKRCRGVHRAPNEVTAYRFVSPDGTNLYPAVGLRWRTRTVAASGAYTVTAQDHMTNLVFTSSSAWTANLPAIATSRDFAVACTQQGTGQGTIDGNASETIIGQTTYLTRAQNETVTLIGNATEWGML